MTRVLVVDDEPGLRFALREVLEDRGDQVIEAASAKDALACDDVYDVVITDLAMPEMSGMELLEQLAQSQPALPVIVLTAQGSERAAVAALKAGAWDYLTKPFDIDEVCAAVARAGELAAARAEARQRTAERVTGGRIIGTSGVFKRLLNQVEKVAAKNVTVLLRGETGTGKELIASLLHAGSPRRDRPIVRFNCAALPENLAEAELFGHVKGAFTGATSDSIGYFERAHTGTLVLDEIAELPLALQPKLLRALQSGEIQPVGARADRSVDVRVVASTHQQLSEAVAKGSFREDLYYRLAVVELEVPPLRERGEDIGLIAEELRRRTAARLDLPQVPLPAALLERFGQYAWPGNVRELENAITRLLALGDDGHVDAATWTPGSNAHATGADTGLRDQVAAFERGILEQTLRDTGGNKSEAARRLRITRTTLLDKLSKYGLR